MSTAAHLLHFPLFSFKTSRLEPKTIKLLPITTSEIFDKSTLNKLLPSHFAKVENFDEIIRPYIEKNESDLIQRLTRTDFNNYLPEDILVKVDRASMLNSLEIRAPFLDYRIIEFAYSKVPSYLKTTTTDQKILLKKLAQKILPKEFDLSRKQGFSIPLKDWLKSGSFRDLFFDVLNDSQCIFDKKVIQSLFNGLDNGYSNGERLFSLVIFELWRREYSINV
jgi:asparagine synthase (glutamine-hydrolysing)